MVLIICTKNELNLTSRYWDMVPDRQKVRTDGRTDGIDRRRQNYIPSTSLGDNKSMSVASMKISQTAYSLEPLPA